ncbi:hypothetical protein BC829DRAFT_360647 [Chytridium lagenaria]|nr:hypothetical protein BC829DRAFT_360647 [Chytridium lagenaria]
MSRHSKNNTALAFFTNAERQKLNYGTQKQRLGRDSMRNFDACFLCIQTAIDPLCCPKGHLACKECFYENLLSQKKEIARQQKLAETQKQAIEDELRKREETAKEAELRDFEKTQTKFLPTSGKTASSLTKRDKPKLPSFWVVSNLFLMIAPSLTPDAVPTIVEEPKKTLMCTACDPPHSITSLKKLQKVVFSLPSSKSEEQKGSVSVMCPSCMKTMNNGSKMIVTKGCGHVVCKGCYTQFVKMTGKCYVCEEKFKDSETIQLFVEGTGFVGSGAQVEAKRSGIAFNKRCLVDLSYAAKHRSCNPAESVCKDLILPASSM